MEIGSEISNKIRSAIKAKLVELGAYVDDELPDYIMVMVANKKNHSQMSEDLGLFLGQNTKKFTSWLNSLLIKLQSISGDHGDGKKKKKPGMKKKNKRKSLETDATTVSQEEKEDVGEQTTVLETAVPDDEPELTVQADTDEFTEEMQQFEEKIKASDDSLKPVSSELAVKVADVSVEPAVNTSPPVAAVYKPSQKVEATVTPSDVKPTTVTSHVKHDSDEHITRNIVTVGRQKQTFIIKREDGDVNMMYVQPTSVSLGTKQQDRDVNVMYVQPTSMSLVTRTVSQTVVGQVSRVSQTVSSQPGRGFQTVAGQPGRGFQTVAGQPGRGFQTVAGQPGRVSQTVSSQPGRGFQTVAGQQGRMSQTVAGRVCQTMASQQGQYSQAVVGQPGQMFQTVTRQQGRVAIKRKTLPSMVGTVIHTPEVQEEEYDPYNPTVGSVASVVRVTARKSSVPPSMQANKSLLLKAMTAAEKSVLTARSLSTPEPGVAASQAYVKPMRRQIPVSQSYTPTQLELTSRSRKQEIMRNMKYTIRNQREMLVRPQPSVVIEYKSVPASVLESDSRVVECDPQEDVLELEPQDVDSSPEVVTPVMQSVEAEADVRIPEILHEDITDEFIQDPVANELCVTQEPVANDKHAEKDETVEDRARIIKEKPKVEVEPAPVSSNTRFIVTLDGVDPDEYDEDVSDDVAVDVRKPELIQQVFPQVIPKVTPPKIKPFSISLKDSDEEDEGDTPLKKAKMSERCRFWPACVNGNACQYHHPSIPCKTFPLCKFGDKCLYIHPNCMFDARCTKPDCPYTHASRRNTHTSQPQAMQQPMVIIAAPPPSAPRPIQCKFFPNCHNTQCPFIHPKTCRFGINCMRKSTCPFHHPAFHEKERLTWSANKITMPKR